MRYPVWKTKDGQKIPINKMDDAHLINTIRYLEKRAVQIILSVPYPNFNGEMAQMAAEQEWEHMMSEVDPETIFPILPKLKELAIKRNLDWSTNE